MELKIVKDGEVVYALERKKFTISCEKPQPPIVKIDVVLKNKIMIENQICHELAYVYAAVEAPGRLEGKGAFVGTEFFSAPQAISLQKGERTLVGAERPIHWRDHPGEAASPPSGKPPLRTQSFKLGFNIVNDRNELIYAHPQKLYKVTCSRPKINEGILATTDEMTVQPKAPKQNVKGFGSKASLGQKAKPGLDPANAFSAGGRPSTKLSIAPGAPDPDKLGGSRVSSQDFGLTLGNIGATADSGIPTSADKKSGAPKKQAAMAAVNPRNRAAAPSSLAPEKREKPDVKVANVKRIGKHKIAVKVRNRKGSEAALNCRIHARTVRKNNSSKTAGAPLAKVGPGQTASVVLEGIPVKKRTKRIKVWVRCPGETNLANNAYTLE